MGHLMTTWTQFCPTSTWTILTLNINKHRKKEKNFGEHLPTYSCPCTVFPHIAETILFLILKSKGHST